MEYLAASRTALATSLMRAAHTRLDPNPLINDPWGDRLFIDESLRRSRAHSNVITRTRFAEDALQLGVVDTP